jgi:hypothetical protein
MTAQAKPTPPEYHRSLTQTLLVQGKTLLKSLKTTLQRKQREWRFVGYFTPDQTKTPRSDTLLEFFEGSLILIE